MKRETSSSAVADATKSKETWTLGPWVVQRLNHIAGDLWLQIGLPSGFGPVAGIVGDDTAEPTFKPVAGMKYLVTPETEQWANAHLIATAPALYEALKATRCPRADFDGDTCEWWVTQYGSEPCARCAALALAEGKIPERDAETRT